MLRAASTYAYVRQRLHPGMLEGLARSGAETIEVFAAHGHFEWSDRAHVRELASWFSNSGVALNSIHSPMYFDDEWDRRTSAINIAIAERKRQIEAMDEIKRVLEVAERLPFRFLVQHLGTSGESFDERKFEAALTSIEHLRAFAKPLGVTIALENIPNELSTPEKLVEFVHGAHFDDVGFCFDTGHAHITGTVRKDFELMRANIRTTHVHDNAGDRDSHLWPGEGTIDWGECMSLLRSAPHSPALLMEIEGSESESIPRGLSQAFRKLEEFATVGQ